MKEILGIVKESKALIFLETMSIISFCLAGLQIYALVTNLNHLLLEDRDALKLLIFVFVGCTLYGLLLAYFSIKEFHKINNR